jgi:Secretion system C-terminal sorting domain
MKRIYFIAFAFIIFLIPISPALCQTVTNGSFDGTRTGWDNCGCSGCDAAGPETVFSQECYDAASTGTCVQYGNGSGSDNNNCGTGCTGNPSPNYLAEVDQGNSKALCQNISGFTSGTTRTLYLTLGRRTDARGGGGAAATQIVQVCIGTACTTITRTSSTSTLTLTTTAWTFTVPATGTLQLKITNISTYSGPDNSNYGMIFSYIGFSAPTPVNLINFTAIKNGSEVDINWQTATEINNDYFTIEKSKNGIDFTTVGIFDGAGNSQSTLNYQTTDHSPYNGISYYRLKQTDFDGKSSYSKIEAVNSSGNKNITVYPNPGTGIFNIQGLNGETEISVQNMLGQMVLIKKDSSDSSEIDLSGQPSGMYYIKVNNGETSASTKIILHR